MSKIEINHNLSRRHFALYDYLKDKGDQWTTQYEIVSELKEFYGAVDCDNFHDSQARHILTKDIRTINEGDYLPKPVLSSGRGVKIANEQEFNDYIASNISSVLRRLKRLKKLAEKGGRNGQYRIKLSDYQKDIVEAFVD